MKTKQMKMKFALTAGALALASGSLAHAAGNGFDVNDLNILFATGADGKLVPEIPLDDRMQAPSLFNDVQAEATKLGIGTPPQNDAEKAAVMKDPNDPSKLLNFHVGSDKKQWRIVSLRFDSCFPAVPKDDSDTKNCVEHVRLIAQPISLNKQNGEDTTMHLLYAVQGVTPRGPRPGFSLRAGDEKSQATVIGQLMALKAAAKAAGVDTNGAPLGVHPALANPATQAAFAAQVKAFIARNCTTDKLMVLTYMGLQGRGPEPWIFFGGNANVAAGGGPGRWKVDFQPTTGPQTVPQTGAVLPGSEAIVFSNINQPNMDGKTGKVVPHPHVAFINNALMEGSDVNVANLFDKSAAQFTQADKDAVNLVEQPKIHAPHNTDCFSCHATNTQARINNIPPTNDARTFLVKDGITAYVDRDTQPSTSWNVRNFGYFGRKPSVSYLTAQSAGDVVNFTNKQLGLTNPGITCGSAAKQLALRTCTMFGAAGGTQLPFIAAQGQASCVSTAGCSR